MHTLLVALAVVLVLAAAAAGTLAEVTNAQLRRTLARYSDD